MNILNDILNKVVGLSCIIIADRDGIPIMKAYSQKVPETVLMSGFLSTFGMAAFQARKLGIGENTTTISVYSSYQVVQMELHGMTLTFIGDKDCNTGHILSISKELSPSLMDLHKILEQV